MDPFRVLPAELMIEILHAIDDFYGLVSLTKVSPHAESVCAAYALPILNNLTKWYPLFYCPYSYRDADLPLPIRGIFRCLALILSEPPSDIDTVRIHLGYTQDCPWSVVPIKLGPQRANVVAFQLIRIAARIQRLACMCLLTMVGNLYCAVSNSKYLGPERVASFIPFSWVEEYRVYQALWNLQLFSIYFYYTQLKWGWSDEEAQALSIEIPWQFKPKYKLDDEIPSVTNVLIQLGLTPKQICHLPLFDFDEMEQIMDHNDYPPSCVWSPPPTPDANNNEHSFVWNQRPEDAIARVSNGTHQCERMLVHSNTTFPTKTFLGIQLFHPDGPERPLFQEMGLFIWDALRMCSVGLSIPDSNQQRLAGFDILSAPPVQVPYCCPGDRAKMLEILIRWWSLLGKYPQLPPIIAPSFIKANAHNTFWINDPEYQMPTGQNLGIASADGRQMMIPLMGLAPTFFPGQPLP